MRILFLGDLFGRTGREAVATHLPSLKEKLSPDVIIANGDNAAHGRGITQKICEELYALGIDCITSGDHVWDQREIIAYIGRDKKLIRPLNYVKATPGNGVLEISLPSGQKLSVIHLQGRVFLQETDNPFAAVDEYLKTIRFDGNHQVFVDIHAEATSEKMGMGQYLDGRVSAVVGTHTHIPTADAQILPKGTGYQTDAGMCGDYNSVIGATSEDAIYRFTTRMPRPLVPADGEGTLCGVFVITDDQTGLTKSIDPVRIGPRLQQARPA